MPVSVMLKVHGTLSNLETVIQSQTGTATAPSRGASDSITIRLKPYYLCRVACVSVLAPVPCAGTANRIAGTMESS